MAGGQSSIPVSPRKDIAANKIQRFWKSYWDRRVYRHYRDLIRFRERGDPALLLRSINPTEAKYAEAAAGLHVRFRLGGETYPPMVFYKIYTHRPVTDVCSFCPRDYAALSKKRQKKQPGSQKRSISDPPGTQKRSNSNPPGSSGRSGECQEDWYLRWENNGWRPVAENLLQPVDPVTEHTAAIRRPFHYSKLRRREDLEQLTRRKKLEWLRQMYKSGREGVECGSDGPEGPATKDGGLVEDELLEDSELLSWTSGLNFESYQREWLSLATSSQQDGQDLT